MASLHLVVTLLNRHGGTLLALGVLTGRSGGPQTDWVVIQDKTGTLVSGLTADYQQMWWVTQNPQPSDPVIGSVCSMILSF